MNITDKELDRRLAALPRETDTPEALWPIIEQRIAHRHRRTWLGGIAAAVLLGVLAALIANHFRDFQQFDLQGTASLAATVIAAEVEAMGRAAPDPGNDLFEGGAGSLESAWNVNQNAIDELERALKNNPGNRLLLDLLARARLRQSELVNQATAAKLVDNQRS